MRSAVIVGPIAVTTEYWEESQADGTRETGCRVQLRRVRETWRRRSRRRSHAAMRSSGRSRSRSGGRTCSRWSAAPRRFDAAHYHPTFTGLVPCDRVGDPAIEADPLAWIERRLADVPGMLAEAGYPELAADARSGRSSARRCRRSWR